MSMTAELELWRKSERAELTARRLAIPAAQRAAWSADIARLLIAGFPLLNSRTLGFYWPFRGEPDMREAVLEFRRGGATLALPVVAAKGAPLEFRIWSPDTPMRRGVLDLPIPTDTAVVRPDVLLIPPLGFDQRGYRLGYGGGFFDRTLAARVPQPLKLGIAFESSRIGTIYPCDHDVPMDFIVTEVGIHRVRGDGLSRVNADEAHAIAAAILRERDGDAGEEVRGYASPPCYAHEIDPDY